MKIRLFVLFFLILSPGALSFAQTTHLDTKFQEWNEIQLILPLIRGKDAKEKKIDKLTAVFTGNLRLGRSSPEFVDNRIGLTLEYRLNRFFSLMTGALYRRDEIVNNRRFYETRFDTGGIFSIAMRGFIFRNRQMFEHRFRNFRADTNFYRNRIQISYPLKHHKKELFTPYVSEEGYFDLGAHRWATNELFAGISRRISKRTVVDLAYVRNNSLPYTVSGLSVGFRIKLR